MIRKVGRDRWARRDFSSAQRTNDGAPRVAPTFSAPSKGIQFNREEREDARIKAYQLADWSKGEF